MGEERTSPARGRLSFCSATIVALLLGAFVTFSAARPACAQTPATARRPTRSDASHGLTVRASPVRDRTASEYLLPTPQFTIVAPTRTDQVVGLVPGVWVSNDGGEGHASNVYLRGFFGDDGSDVAISVEGVPLNEIANPEHHGYVDLGVIIPEAIARIDATAGVSDPRQGDFAVAGSVDFRLGVRERGTALRLEGGSYGFARFVGALAPRGESEQTFAVAEAARADGVGVGRNVERAGAMGQLAITLSGNATLRVLLDVHGSRWSSPGVVRDDDVQAGRVDFFGTYPANAGLGGRAMRGLASAALEWHSGFQRLEARAFAMVRAQTMTENFTGYLDHPVLGDRVGYAYDGGTLGSNGFYRRTVMLGGRAQDGEVGWIVRYDRARTSARSVDSMQNLPLVPPDPSDAAADVDVASAGAYADLVVRPFTTITLRGGGRVDVSGYDERVTTFADPAGPRVGHVTALGVRAGPKATVDLHLGRGVSVIASYGTGFRSPDVFDVASSGAVRFASVSGEDVGVRYGPPGFASASEQFIATLTAFHTAVDQDVVFDPVTAREADIGATDRWGAALWARLHVRWFDANGAVTYTYAVAGQNALDGRIRSGAPLPSLPALVARLDAAADEQVATVREWPLRLRAGVVGGVRSAPPMLFTNSYPTVVLDAAAGARLGPFALDVTLRNIPDLRNRDAQFEYRSTFTPGVPAATVPALHFSAGAPRTLLVTLTLYD